MKNLKERIEKLVDEKYWKMGHMGTETISFALELTDAEIEKFHNLELPDNYGWDINGNELNLSYSEEIG